MTAEHVKNGALPQGILLKRNPNAMNVYNNALVLHRGSNRIDYSVTKGGVKVWLALFLFLLLVSGMVAFMNTDAFSNLDSFDVDIDDDVDESDDWFSYNHDQQKREYEHMDDHRPSLQKTEHGGGSKAKRTKNHLKQEALMTDDDDADANKNGDDVIPDAVEEEMLASIGKPKQMDPEPDMDDIDELETPEDAMDKNASDADDDVNNDDESEGEIIKKLPEKAKPKRKVKLSVPKPVEKEEVLYVKRKGKSRQEMKKELEASVSVPEEVYEDTDPEPAPEPAESSDVESDSENEPEPEPSQSHPTSTHNVPKFKMRISRPVDLPLSGDAIRSIRRKGKKVLNEPVVAESSDAVEEEADDEPAEDVADDEPIEVDEPEPTTPPTPTKRPKMRLSRPIDLSDPIGPSARFVRIKGKPKVSVAIKDVVIEVEDDDDADHDNDEEALESESEQTSGNRIPKFKMRPSPPIDFSQSGPLVRSTRLKGGQKSFTTSTPDPHTAKVSSLDYIPKPPKMLISRVDLSVPTAGEPIRFTRRKGISLHQSDAGTRLSEEVEKAMTKKEKVLAPKSVPSRPTPAPQTQPPKPATPPPQEKATVAPSGSCSATDSTCEGDHDDESEEQSNEDHQEVLETIKSYRIGKNGKKHEVNVDPNEGFPEIRFERVRGGQGAPLKNLYANKDAHLYPVSKSKKVEVKVKLSSKRDVRLDITASLRFRNNAVTSSADSKILDELDAGAKLLDANKPADVLDFFNRLLSYHPTSPRAHFGKARALDMLAERRQSNSLLEQGIDQYESLLALPDVPDELFHLAANRLIDRTRFRGWMQRTANAQQLLIDRFPDDIEVLNQYAVTFLMMGRNQDAKRVFLDVLRKKPADGFAKVHYAFIVKTVDHNYTEAVEYFEEGIASEQAGTQDGRFYFHLGDALQRLNRNDEAIEWYAKAAEIGLFLSAYQRSLYNVDNLTSRPWWTIDQTGHAKDFKAIEKQWAAIRDEGLALLTDKGQFLAEDENLTEQGDWKQFTLFQKGRKVAKNCERAPKTCSIVEGFVDAVGCTRGQIKFSVMHPGTKVWPHCGPTNCRLRAHLGLQVPSGQGIKIRVANETKQWKQGKFIVFDDSFEHEVWHDGPNKLRLILIVDIWHPDLTDAQKSSLSPI